MTRYWFDTEFMEDGNTIELLSIGIVDEDGRSLYLENADADHSHANEWVQANVLPHLGKREFESPMGRAQLAGEFARFVNGGATPPEFWAYYADYDWVVLCQLYGKMIDLPPGWPMFCMDVKQLAVMLGNPRLPEQTTTEHHALADAIWTREAWVHLATKVVCAADPFLPFRRSMP